MSKKSSRLHFKPRSLLSDFILYDSNKSQKVVFCESKKQSQPIIKPTEFYKDGKKSASGRNKRIFTAAQASKLILESHDDNERSQTTFTSQQGEQMNEPINSANQTSTTTIQRHEGNDQVSNVTVTSQQGELSNELIIDLQNTESEVLIINSADQASTITVQGHEGNDQDVSNVTVTIQQGELINEPIIDLQNTESEVLLNLALWNQVQEQPKQHLEQNMSYYDYYKKQHRQLNNGNYGYCNEQLWQQNNGNYGYCNEQSWQQNNGNHGYCNEQQWQQNNGNYGYCNEQPCQQNNGNYNYCNEQPQPHQPSNLNLGCNDFNIPSKVSSITMPPKAIVTDANTPPDRTTSEREADVIHQNTHTPPDRNTPEHEAIVLDQNTDSPTDHDNTPEHQAIVIDQNTDTPMDHDNTLEREAIVIDQNTDTPTDHDNTPESRAIVVDQNTDTPLDRDNSPEREAIVIDQNTDNTPEHEAIVFDLNTDTPMDRDNIPEREAHVIEPTARKGRKRFRDEANWKQNIKIKNRLLGLPYVSSRNKMVASKSPKQCNCSCRYHCTQNFSETERTSVCAEFYKLGSWIRQNDFICQTVTAGAVARRRVKESGSPISVRRTKSCTFTLMKENQSHRVCKSFYIKTLCISSKRVRRALQEKGDSNTFKGQDKRKGKASKRKTTAEQNAKVKQHIEEFPKIEPHYCRRDSTKQYLSPELNLRKMYSLYKEDFCVRENISNPVTCSKYRDIFVTEFDLKFFIPKKDQCTQCKSYYQGNEQYKESVKATWDEHKKREKEAFDGKLADKQRSLEDRSFLSITFDLQAVLYTPYSGDCQIFYRRKLAVYNFTIYEANTKNGICYLWDETEGRRGTQEISTALLLYFRSLPQTIKSVASFSDTCAGQNRNKYICATMLYAVQSTHLETIQLKYMESGHSYMEVDSIHATIENARKHQAIYTPKEWHILIRGARKNPKPYIVKPLSHCDFLDIKKFASQFIRNTSKTIDGEPVRWLNIKWLQFVKDEPNLVRFKYHINEETFKVINVCGNVSCNIARLPMESAYKEGLPISKAKNNDLLHLLRTRVIPQEYSDFYYSLPSSDKEEDRLAEPDIEEQNDEEYDGAAGPSDEHCIQAVPGSLANDSPFDEHRIPTIPGTLDNDSTRPTHVTSANANKKQNRQTRLSVQTPASSSTMQYVTPTNDFTGLKQTKDFTRLTRKRVTSAATRAKQQSKKTTTSERNKTPVTSSTATDPARRVLRECGNFPPKASKKKLAMSTT